MNKRETALLGRAFGAEIDSALSNGRIPPIMQTRSKLAKELVEQGLLQEASAKIDGPFRVTVSGYSLTAAGHLAYCLTCDEDDA